MLAAFFRRRCKTSHFIATGADADLILPSGLFLCAYFYVHAKSVKMRSNCELTLRAYQIAILSKIASF